MRRATPFLILILFSLLTTACVLIQPTPTPMPAPTPTPTATPPPPADPSTPLGFSQFLIRLDSARLADRPFILNEYWAQIEQTPLVDSENAVFLYRGEATTVQLRGDMTGYDDTQLQPLTRIEGTDLWWYEGSYEADARLDYQLVLGDQRIRDPRNPHTVPSGFGLQSELRMAAYRDPQFLVDPESYAAGTLTEHTIDSSFLGSSRTFLVYQSASQLVGARPPVLIVQDGAEAISLVDMPNLFNTLIGRREVTPMVVAFVPPLNRIEEYWRDDNYADFLAEEVLPLIQQEYETDTAPEKTGLLGASMGGLISLHTAMRHPDKFGLVAAQSGAFVVDDDSIINELAQADALPLKIDLVVGTYETSISPDRFPDPDFYAGNRRLAALLEDKGYDYRFTEFAEGHSWGLWRAQLGPTLDFLYR